MTAHNVTMMRESVDLPEAQLRVPLKRPCKTYTHLTIFTRPFTLFEANKMKQCNKFLYKVR